MGPGLCILLKNGLPIHGPPRGSDKSEVAMLVGVPKETVAGERRVALVPDRRAKLTKAGLEVIVQRGGGTAGGFADAAYQESGARLEENVLPQADILLKVQPPTAEESGTLKEGATLIGSL